MPFKITIVADHWPKETSWVIEDTELGGVLAQGGSDDLVPGEEVDWVECINNRNGCYLFTIKGEASVNCRTAHLSIQFDC